MRWLGNALALFLIVMTMLPVALLFAWLFWTENPRLRQLRGEDEVATLFSEANRKEKSGHER